MSEKRNKMNVKDGMLPLVFVVGGAVLWFHPERIVSVFLLMTALFISPVAPSLFGPCMHRLVQSLPGKNVAVRALVSVGLSVSTSIIEEINKNDVYLNNLISEVIKTVRKIGSSNELKEVFKDEELQEEIVLMTKNILLIASRDEELKGIIQNLLREELSMLLKDEAYMVEEMSNFRVAAVQTLQKPKLRDDVLLLLKEAIIDAVEDDDFTVGIVSSVIAASLVVTKENVGPAVDRFRNRRDRMRDRFASSFQT